jgi:zinc and cadmium transporter
MAIISVLTISLFSIFLIFLIISRFKNISTFTFLLVSLAVGTLLGDAFIHLIPQSFESIDSQVTTSLLVLLGIIIYFILEKILRFRHCHQPDCHEDIHQHVVPLSIIGDSLHNFFDGIVIAASFQVNIPLGIATSLAVLLHEIPQEIGDFAIMLHHRYSLKKALFLNLVSGAFSLLGVLTTFIFSQFIQNFSLYLLPVTAGAFIYLASSDLIPELHRHSPKPSLSLIQLSLLIIGIILMYSLSFFE